MYLGVIADDFTGGTDIAGFLVQNGLSVTQYIGVPDASLNARETDAAVVSLKSRSCPKEEAVDASLAALRWLREQGCEQIFFKYCSTFDSTAKGNIGPVTDALLDALGGEITVMAPALPVNGRTVYLGYLFVNGVPLNESGMRHHPVTPMLDANLMRLTEQQSRGKAANIPVAVVDAGPEAIRENLQTLRENGYRYAVPDALTEEHLVALGEAVSGLPLVTGGSGLGMGVARRIRRQHGLDGRSGTNAGKPPGGRCVVLAGSASVMTNAQVARYSAIAQAKKIDVRRCLTDADGYAAEVAAWIGSLAPAPTAPLVYATTGPDELVAIQKTLGAEASGLAVERFFAALAARLLDAGVDHFIVAGGETSGSVVKALGIKAFHIGPQIAPGVPWVRALDRPVSLALKSGNFGNEDFFSTAQDFFK
ncbi:MAG: four-carbon acid sugar kinase family protein [Deltaproteobacteria bacterium]|nr:four-carbon acid sugar kinase family protein [Deltaproteobacteria bacterium]